MRLLRAIVTVLLAVAITALLLFRFYIMLFFPGTLHTMALFHQVLPYWQPFSLATGFLAAPVTLLGNAIHTLLPASMASWFPKAPAAQVMVTWQHLPADKALAEYPGAAEWCDLLAIPFWLVMLLALSVAWQLFEESLPEVMAPGFWRNIEAVLVSTLQQLADKKPAQQKTGRHRNPSADEEENNPPADSPEKPKTQKPDNWNQRLGQIKQQQHTGPLPPASPPPLPRGPLSAETSAQFKQQLGDQAMQQVMRDLQHENLKLQQHQQFLQSAVSQYFSPRVLEYLENNRINFAQMQNQKRTISVLFCDIRNFSSLSQTLSADELTAFLNNYFSITIHMILNVHDGVINKLMGDGLIAYWGFPIPNEQHALSATRTAIDILHEIDLYNSTNPEGRQLDIGIGIATGEVVIGNIGSQDFKDFTVIGNAVNLASRLDELNKELNTRLLLSPETYNSVKASVPCKSHGPVPIRGWAEPMPVYEAGN